MRTLRAFRPSAVELEGRISLSSIKGNPSPKPTNTSSGTQVHIIVYWTGNSQTFYNAMAADGLTYMTPSTPAGNENCVEGVVSIANLSKIEQDHQVAGWTVAYNNMHT